MRKSIAILIIAAIAAVTPLVVYADVVPPIGAAASDDVNSPNAISGGNATDNLLIVELNRKLAELDRKLADIVSEQKLDIKILKAQLDLVDPKSRFSIILRRQLQQMEEQNDKLQKQLQKQIDERERFEKRREFEKREWRWREWRIVPL